MGEDDQLPVVRRPSPADGIGRSLEALYGEIVGEPLPPDTTLLMNSLSSAPYERRSRPPAATAVPKA